MIKERKVDYSKKFSKQFRKAPLEIKIAFKERFTLFVSDPTHPKLNSHQLIGKYSGLKSINITGDWRAIFQEIGDIEGHLTIIFLFLGTHSQLYK